MVYSFFSNNAIQFMFQLLVSESVFLIGQKRKEYFKVKLIISIILEFVLSYVWLYLLNPLADQNMLVDALRYFGYAVLTFVLIITCFEVKILDIVFIITGGYAAEHMTFTLGRMLLYLCHISYGTYGSLIHLLVTRYLFFIIGAVVVYLVIIRGNRSKNGFGNGDLRIAALSIITVVGAIAMSVYWAGSSAYNGTFMGEIICPSYSFLCCMLVLLMEYYVLRENSMKREQEMMEQLLQMSDNQQKSAKEAIDIINIKCHDLKHQIRALAKMDDAKSRSDYLQEVQEAVSIYDATYQTGSQALDYVLREKSLLFNEKNVEFSCMIEGAMIGFISPSDIYALMGNALDNALEQVLTEAEDERIISLNIRRHGEMILIHLENRCSSTPEFRDGLPVTTKKDRAQHGFGVKSMRYIVEKYDGEFYMGIKEGKFYLDILFKKKEKKES